MSAAPRLAMSEAEYLEYDFQSEGRNEFVNGDVVAMAGAEPVHSHLVARITIALGTRLAGQRCTVHASDLRVRVDETGMYAYPDLVVVCEKPAYADTRPKTLLNPRVVVEVLSDATEEYDRGAKFAHYQRRASLEEYVLVSATQRRVEHYRRIEPGRWELVITEGTGTVAFPALSLTLPMDEVYADFERVLAESAETVG